MRTQNEGTGKSSWWVINPDAKPGKSPRRRAQSMDTKAYEKKRKTARKKAEQYRAQLAASGAASQEDLYGSDFQLSPEGLRHRTSSNASSVNGQRLSPISQQNEFEYDMQHPQQSALLFGNAPGIPKTDVYSQDTTKLADSLAEIIIDQHPSFLSVDSPSQHLNHPPAGLQYNPMMPGYGHQQQSYTTVQAGEISPLPPLMSNSGNPYLTDLTALTPMSTMAEDVKPVISQHASAFMNAGSNNRRTISEFINSSSQPSILRQALSAHKIAQQNTKPSVTNIGGLNYDEHGNHIPDDLDSFVDNFGTPTDLSCDIAHVINHEMSFGDGNLDFAFNPTVENTPMQPMQQFYINLPTATINR